MAAMDHIRPMAVAGCFYDADPVRLDREVSAWCQDAPPITGTLRGLIAPHAGFVYSGSGAGAAYGAGLLSSLPTTVLLSGPSHFFNFSGVALPAHAGLASPLGANPVSAQTDDLRAAFPFVSRNGRVHEPEHALETQLPFIQKVWGDIDLIPLLSGRIAPSELAELMEWVLDFLPGSLLAVSSDLSHFLPDPEARDRDLQTAEAIEALAPDRIGADDACGHTSVNALLRVAARRGWAVQRQALFNSGDRTGNREQVVGYGAWVFTENAA